MSLGHKEIAAGKMVVGIFVAGADVLVKITTVRKVTRALIY